MSFWGATVITNLFSVVPIYGPQIVTWLWGAFNVGNATLNRFFSLHYLLPFLIAALSLVHIAYIHKDGSNNPLGINGNIDKIPFYPYFITKDLFSFVIVAIFFSIFVFFAPNLLGRLMAFVFVSVHNFIAVCWKILKKRIYKILIKFYSFYKCIKKDIVSFIVFVYSQNKTVTMDLNLKMQDNTQFSKNKFNFFGGKSSQKKDQSAGNSYRGSSETTRDISYNPQKKYISDNIHINENKHGNNLKKGLDNKDFYYWLGGLIDGDGSLLLNKKGYVNFEITLDEKDIQTLAYIKKELGFGNITKRSKAKAYRLRTAKKQNIMFLLQVLENKLLTPEKQKQWIICSNAYQYKSQYEKLNEQDIQYIITNTSWLSGFFDAEGYFNIMNRTTLAWHIGQKNKKILEEIFNTFLKITNMPIGHIRYDKKNNFWIYSITNKEGIRFILKHFKKFPIYTTKAHHVYTFKRLLFFIDKKYHIQEETSKKYKKIMNLIYLFKKKI
jgi:hypothetical protein